MASGNIQYKITADASDWRFCTTGALFETLPERLPQRPLGYKCESCAGPAEGDRCSYCGSARRA